MGTEANKGPVLGMRHVQALLLFLNVMTLYCSRLNIGVAVVAMTNAEISNPDFEEFDWNEKEISYVLSSFFWGYVVTQFPGGILCKRFGAKIVMFTATLISALFSALTPWCVRWGGWQIFCVIRFIQGLAQAPIFPCIYEHLAKWSPAEERNRMGAFFMTGADFGTILAMATSGIIANGAMGWPGISYVSAGLCFVWCLLWLIFGANNPSNSKFIGETEKHYIESSIALTLGYSEKKIPFPWKAVFTSVPFYVLVIARCAQNWGLSTLQAQIPSYMNGILKMDIKANGLYSAVPFLVMLAMSYIYLILADVLHHKKILSLTALRRLFNSVSFWLPALCLIAIGFLDINHKTLAIVLITLSAALNSGNTIGSALNIIDLAPNHAGVLMSIINTTVSFTPFISPLVVGVIVTDMGNRSMWQIVFAIAAAIFFFGNLFYIVFGTTEAQPWNAENFSTLKDMEGSMKCYGNNIDYSEISIKKIQKNGSAVEAVRNTKL